MILHVQLEHLALGLVVGLWLYLYFSARAALAPRLSPGEAAGIQVTAYMPARNERAVIASSVGALLAQGPVLSRLVLVDDGSSDGTSEAVAELAKDPRLVLLQGEGPAPGERGKPAALRTALRASPPESDWLLFIDADVVLEPGAIAALYQHALATGADLVSVFPKVVLGSALEQMMMPPIGALVVRRFPFGLVAEPKSTVAFANGQLILVRRTAYEKVGGHGAVVAEILEDVALARLIKAAGFRLALADGRALATTRMYEGWSELVEGWAKNLYLLLGARPFPALLWIPLLPLLAASGWIAGLAAGLPYGPIGCLLILALQADLRRRGGAHPAYVLFAPFGALLAAWVLALSCWRFILRRPIPWKGRSYG